MAKRQQVCQLIEDYFKANDYSYSVNEEDTESWNLVTGFQDSENQNEVIGVIISVYEDSLIVNSIASKKLNTEKFNDLAEFLMRVNGILKRGCFMINCDNRYEVSMRIWATIKGRFTDNDISYLLNVSLGSFSLVMPWLNKISNGELPVLTSFEGYKQAVEP